MKTIFLATVGWVGLAVASGSELTQRIHAEAQLCADALVSGDYAGVIARTHPRIVTEMGGAQAGATAIAETMAEMKVQGIAILSAVITEPVDPVASGATVATIVPQTITLKTPTGRFRQAGNLLAVSDDGGAHWSFIDTSTLDDALLVAYFPSLAGLIKLPAKAPMVPIPD